MSISIRVPFSTLAGAVELSFAGETPGEVAASVLCCRTQARLCSALADRWILIQWLALLALLAVCAF